MKFRQFSNIGWRVSEIGLGCWAIGSEWGDVSHEDATEVLKTLLTFQYFCHFSSIDLKLYLFTIYLLL